MTNSYWDEVDLLEDWLHYRNNPMAFHKKSIDKLVRVTQKRVAMYKTNKHGRYDDMWTDTYNELNIELQASLHRMY